MPWIQSFGLVFPILTSVFITSTSIVVAYISARAYMRWGLLSVLFLGCGALVFGCTSLLASMLLGAEGLDFSATVFTMGALLSAVFQLACASLTYLGGTPRPGRGYHVSLWVPVALLSVVAIVVVALEGVLPPFYAIGEGTTGIGQVALGAAAVAYAGSAGVMAAVYLSSRSGVLYWYSLALGATTAGILGLILSNGDVQAVAMRLGWAGLYLGGLCLLASVLSAERLSDLPSGRRGRPTSRPPGADRR